MGRRTLYRSFSFTDPNEVNRLQSSLQGLPLFHSGNYMVELVGGCVGMLETNLPMSELRAWFRSAGVPMRDHVTDTVSTDERYKEY